MMVTTMKTILAILLVMTLSACGGNKAAKHQDRFKDTEYYILAQIEAHSRMLASDCKDEYAVRERLNALSFQIELLSTYSFFLPEETETYKVSQLIIDDVYAMKARYNLNKKEPSIVYCKIKAKALTIKTRKVLETFGIIWTQERKPDGRY